MKNDVKQAFESINTAIAAHYKITGDLERNINLVESYLSTFMVDIDVLRKPAFDPKSEQYINGDHDYHIGWNDALDEVKLLQPQAVQLLKVFVKQIEETDFVLPSYGKPGSRYCSCCKANPDHQHYNHCAYVKVKEFLSQNQLTDKLEYSHTIQVPVAGE